MGDGSPKQKERFSRAWVIGAASAADFTYEIVVDDERGVDMTVHSHEHTIDFQLKATSSPEVQDGCLVHDLDVRTYNLLRSEQRSGYGVLAVIVIGTDTASWHVMNDDGGGSPDLPITSRCSGCHPPRTKPRFASRSP